jgi:hypothetical protein
VKNRVLTVDRFQKSSLSRSMTISCEISSEKEFYEDEDQIFNSQLTASDEVPPSTPSPA